MTDITRILNDEILPRVSRAEIFQALKPQDRGDYFECECPACHKRSAYVYKTSTYLKCNRVNECQYSTSIYDYMSGEHAPRGDAWWAVTEKLASMVGITLPEYDEEGAYAADDVVHNRSLLEKEWQAMVDTAKRSLTPGFSSQLGDYIKERGLEGLELGYADGRLMFPVRDRYGALRGWVGRDLSGSSDRKYLYSEGLPLKEIGFIGLDVALKQRSDTLILVEGVIDRLRLNLAGVLNVVALGNANVSSDRFKLLQELGIRKVILALDNDEAGKKGTRDAIERAYDLLIPPEVCVQTYTHKDADEDLSHGIFAATLFGLNVQPAHTWLAKQFIERYPDRNEFIEEVIRFDERISDPLRVAHMALHFFPVIEARLGPFESILEYYHVRKQRNLQQKSNTIIQKAAQAAKVLGNDGKHEEAKEALFAGYRESEALFRTARLEPVRTLNERLLEHEDAIMAYRDREILGLKTDMAGLTAALMGLRGTVFLGSPPNLGKTVLAMQLTLQVLHNEPEACVVYVNLDMDTNDVITRIRCNQGKYEWKTYTQGHSIPIETGRERVQQIGDRLVILDERCFGGNVQELCDVVKSLKQNSKCKRVLLVLDYLQVWDVPEEMRKILRTDNDLDEWRVSVVKQLKGSLNRHDCVFVVSEVRKDAYDKPLGMEDLKGSSRLSYAADTVLLLNRLTSEEYCENFTYDTAYIQTHWPGKRELDSKHDSKKESKQIRERLEQSSIAVAWLQVAKGRDGTLRSKIPVTCHFKTASIVEGFYLDGSPEKTIQGARDERSENVDEGRVSEDADERTGEWWQNQRRVLG